MSSRKGRVPYRHALCFAAALLAAGSSPAQTRYAYSADGAVVTDGQTGLHWQRCSAGQVFSGGTCVGNASTFTHEQALVYARTQAGWRLPNVKELSSIVDTTRMSPSIDPLAFPATPPEWYWSSSPYAGYADSAWFVYFGSGFVFINGRYANYHVRLVR